MQTNKQTNKKTVETNTKWSKNIYLEDAELPEVNPSHPNLQLLNVIPTGVTLSLRNIRVNCKRDQWWKIFYFDTCLLVPALTFEATIMLW